MHTEICKWLEDVLTEVADRVQLETEVLVQAEAVRLFHDCQAADAALRSAEDAVYLLTTRMQRDIDAEHRTQCSCGLRYEPSTCNSYRRSDCICACDCRFRDERWGIIGYHDGEQRLMRCSPASPWRGCHVKHMQCSGHTVSFEHSTHDELTVDQAPDACLHVCNELRERRAAFLALKEAKQQPAYLEHPAVIELFRRLSISCGLKTSFYEYLKVHGWCRTHGFQLRFCHDFQLRFGYAVGHTTTQGGRVTGPGAFWPSSQRIIMKIFINRTKKAAPCYAQ